MSDTRSRIATWTSWVPSSVTQSGPSSSTVTLGVLRQADILQWIEKKNFPLFSSQTCLLQSIHPCSKVEEAWMEVFKVLTMIMKKSYEQGEAPSQQMSLDPTQGRYDIVTQLRDILFTMNVL